MFRHQTLRVVTVGLLLAPYALVVAQELSTSDLVKGKIGNYPAQLKLADLPDDYSAVSISTTADAQESVATLYSMMGFARAGSASAASVKRKLYQCFWSNGDTVTSMRREFLVTYKVDFDPIQIANLGANYSQVMTDGAESFVEPKLKVVLVALETIKTVSPYPELTKKDLLSAFGKKSRDSGSSHLVPGSEEFKSAQSETLNNVKQIGLGLIMYCNDYDDVFPYVQDTNSVKPLIEPYLKNKSLWHSDNSKGGRILFNMGVAGVTSSSIELPAESVLLFESDPWEDGRRAVCFCDGHAKLVTDLEWKLLSRRLMPTGAKREGKPVKVKK